MPPKRRTKSDRQPQSPYAADLAVARARFASFEAARTSSDADLDLLTPGPHVQSSLRAEAIAKSAREAQALAPRTAHQEDAAPSLEARSALEQRERPASEVQEVVGDAVACMFAYTAGLRLLGGDCSSVSPAAATTNQQETSGVSELDAPSCLDLEPEDTQTPQTEAGSHVASLRERFSRPGPPPSARHRMVSPQKTPTRPAQPSASTPVASALLDRNDLTEVLVATLSPKPKAEGCCGESEQQPEACGRVVELANEPACSTVLAVTIDEAADSEDDGTEGRQSVPELSPVVEAQDDQSNARSRKGSPLPNAMTTHLQIGEAKDQADDESNRMRERLQELEAANLAMAKQLSARATAVDLIDELAMSPGLLDSLGDILSPELRSKLRATTSAGHTGQSDHQRQEHQREVAKGRRKRVSASAGLFRCCSAPQQVEH